MTEMLVLHQSNFLPWIGYFNQIALASEFIIYDEVQYTKNDWRNRNKISTSHGDRWITVPTDGNTSKKINQVEVGEGPWRKKMVRTIDQAYRKAEFSHLYNAQLEKIILNQELKKLSDLNEELIRWAAKHLKISTKISRSEVIEYDRSASPTQRIIEICKFKGEKSYLTGPAALNYLEIRKLKNNGIELFLINYDTLKAYPQKSSKFIRGLSIIDLLMHAGSESGKYLTASQSPIR
jgi:hypothetical protein